MQSITATNRTTILIGCFIPIIHSNVAQPPTGSSGRKTTPRGGCAKLL